MVTKQDPEAKATTRKLKAARFHSSSITLSFRLLPVFRFFHIFLFLFFFVCSLFFLLCFCSLHIIVHGLYLLSCSSFFLTCDTPATHWNTSKRSARGGSRAATHTPKLRETHAQIFARTHTLHTHAPTNTERLPGWKLILSTPPICTRSIRMLLSLSFTMEGGPDL